MRRSIAYWMLVLAACASPSLAGQGQRAGAAFGARASARADLADIAVGTFRGEIVSDSRGSSQPDVTLTVVKAGPNRITVMSSNPRLPTFTIGLIRAMQTVQAANGTDMNFLLDLSRRPNRLDVNVDGASWSGTRR